jgi:capsular polysaccharide biosynthesis protein/Mrp family chromosome partitioning ATPase
LVTDQPVQAAPNERWQAEADEPPVDRPGIVSSLLQYWLIVVVATLLGAVAGYGVAQQMPVQYESEALLILSDPGGPSFLGGNPLPSVDRGAYLAKQASIMTSSIVLTPVVEQLGDGQSLRELREQLKVLPSADMAGISIVATGPDPGSAASLANAVGTAYDKVAAERASQAAERAIRSIEKVRTRRQAELDAIPRSQDGQLTPRQQQLSNDIDELEQREQDITEKLALYGSGVELFEQAQRPESPTQPKPKLTALLGALLGLLGAGIWAWWAAARNQRAAGRGDPARILGAPLLGEVPALRVSRAPAGRSAALPPALEPSAADAYHVIVASLNHELAGVGGSSVAVTSVGLGDSRTSTTLSIATAAWEESRKVLLIDADERTRRLSELYGFYEVRAERGGYLPHPQPGERLNADDYIRRLVHTGSAMVLPITRNGTDPDYPGSTYHVPDVHQALSAVGKLFDLVLIDTPAVLAASDALSVAGQADGIVLLLPHGVLLRDLREVRERLAFVKTPLIGYVYVRPSGGVLERWTLGRRRLEPWRRRETMKRVADANGDVEGARGEGGPVPSARRSEP